MWLSPTGYNDPGGTWNEETKVYDNNVGSYAYTGAAILSWSDFLELTIAALDCDKIRFYAYASEEEEGITEIDVDVFYDGAWHHVYEGDYESQVWIEKNLGTSHFVTKARARFYNSNPGDSANVNFNEFDFFQTAWLSPTGHNDPASVWDNETNAYDKNNSTYAECTVSSFEQPTGWLELTIAEMECSKVRFDAFYSAASVNEIELEIFTTVWEPIFRGSFANHTWVEKELGGIKTLTKARVRFYCIEETVTLAKLYEFQFLIGGVARPKVDGSLAGRRGLV